MLTGNLAIFKTNHKILLNTRFFLETWSLYGVGVPELRFKFISFVGRGAQTSIDPIRA